MDWLALISARVVIGAEFPVFFPVTREIGISETSSLVTASSSGESAAKLLIDLAYGVAQGFVGDSYFDTWPPSVLDLVKVVVTDPL